MGNNIELLKQELIKQKELIESRGGFVTVANNNPSPYEITEGIKTVAGNLDLDMATATPSDVLAGKTFYAGISVLQTGTNKDNDFYNLLMHNDSSIEELTTPDNATSLRRYLFAGLNSGTKIVLNPKVETIEEYCFYDSNLGDFSYNNTDQLKTIGAYAFSESNIKMNFSRLPDSVVTIGDRAFYNQVPTNDGYLRIPKNATNVGQFAFSTGTYCEYTDGIYWNDNTNFTTTPQYAFYNQSFVGEFEYPSHITMIKNSCFYNSRFSKVTVPESVTTIESNFYCISPDYASRIPSLAIIFKSVVPPTFKSCPFFYLSRLTTSQLGVYVPDESYEAYKALSQLSEYKNYIRPMSELP